MPSSSPVQNATDSIIESFTSSAKLTTSFTDHTVSSVKAVATTPLNIIKNLLSHPKVKWYVIGMMLCVVIFIYFKYQNKQAAKKQDDFNVQPQPTQTEPHPQPFEQNFDERDKMWVEKINMMQEQFNKQLAVQASVNSQLMEKLQGLNQQGLNQQGLNRPQPPTTQPPMPNTLLESSDETSESEVYIEDKNVMEHNLTAEEMKTIDMQLEDVHLMHN